MTNRVPANLRAHTNGPSKLSVLGLTGLLLLSLHSPVAAQSLAGAARARLQQGNVYLQRGQANEAIREFQAVLRANPNQAQAQLGLAQAYSKLTRWAQAIQAYERLLGLEPRNQTAMRALGEIGGYEGNPQWRRSGIKALTQLLALQPQDPAARFRRAQLLSWSGQLSEALADYQLLLPTERANPSVLIGAAQTYTWAGQYPQALPLFRQAQQVGARFTATESLDYARALGQAGQTEQAVALVGPLLRQNANKPDLVQTAADVLGELEGQEDTALRLYQQLAQGRPGDRFLALNQLRLERKLGKLPPAQAEARLRALVQPLPTAPEPREALAVAVLRFPPTPELIEVYEQFQQAGVNQPFLNFRLAQAQLQRGDIAAARRALDAYLVARPSDLGAQVILAEIAQAEGNLATARQIYQTVLASSPERLDALVGLAAVYASQGNEAEALQVYQQLIALRPTDLNLKADWTRLAYNRNLVSEARAATVIEEWLAAQGDREPSASLIGLVATLPPSAERLPLYQRLLSVAPDSTLLRLRLAQAYLAARDLPRAQTEARKLLEQQPRNLAAYFVVGEAAQILEDYPRAIQAYQQILALEPRNADALRSWAGVEFRRQRYVAATALYERTLAIRPNDRDAKLALTDLAALAGRRLETLERLQELESPPDPLPASRLYERNRQVREDLLLQRGFAPYWERY